MFSGVMEAIQGIPRDDLDLRLEALMTVKKLFKLDSSSRDAFRREGGFVSLVSMIVALEGAFEEPEKYSRDDPINIEVVQDKTVLVLQTVFSVLAESMHQHEVNKHYFMKDVGYETVENAITLTGAFSQRHIAERIFGILFSFAVENEMILELFVTDQDKSKEQDINRRIELTLENSSIFVVNPEIMPVVLRLQQIASAHVQLSQSVLCALLALSQGNTGNQVKMNRSGLILSLFQRLLSEKQEQQTEEGNIKETLVNITKNLMNMGISSNELRYIFKKFNISSIDSSAEYLLDLALHGASGSRWPGFIQFNNPNACLEIPQLADFPPPNPGYTLLFWLHIEKQNDLSSLSLFSIWNDQQQTFRVFIDAKSKMLLIQSSYSKQPILFKSFEFQVGYWYHLVLVHNRSRLASRLSSINTIEKETINMYFNMGPRYKSLFQDSLEQFQTYEATTTLYLTLRNMSKGRRSNSSDKQLLISILGGSAFQSIPENKFVFAFFANNALSEGIHSGLALTGISTATQQKVVSEISNSRMILNSAVPKLDIAVYRPKSMGYLVGEPVVAYSFGLDESIWKIGGCAVALKLIENSQTSKTLCKSIAFLLETIRFSWRNSADMERCHGYEILAYLLKQKRDLITLELFELLLVFIGKDVKNLENSIINNPLAYRYVVLNFEIWKKTSLDVQKAHLEQFILFLNNSKLRSFNVKRLSKSHLVKKLLLAFRMSIYAKELVPHVVHALKAVMLSNWDTEGIRAVATFLASTVAQGNT
ncbi:hypothetical protein RO3G_16112 [Rhizopus delemar RA 99-880]|uniref:Uncharacterized protein n=1 Tax=Rhizopus delemar (strain RA 99-880 / ATCC MYA-4621 / FGSC 9543 / NRRL 43880) TaxID=246409 RepID=I1CSH1_RHIO9|nr:hypothetical protein RO3G_16112 [Rhizopus delemar RA 99-880]|eukprot:EIE91401.1 hypothetical protein RO3G_16112 [Rhizopus delemar RA 99-880]